MSAVGNEQATEKPGEGPGRSGRSAAISTARAAWRALGADSQLLVEEVEVLRLGLDLRRPLRTAVGVHRHRPVVLVRVAARPVDDGPTRGGLRRAAVMGWGECAALADRTYDAEDAEDAARALDEVLVPALLDRSPRVARRGGPLLPVLLPPTGLAGVPEIAGFAREHPLAVAALEMAVADAHLRAAGTSWSRLLGVEGRRVAAGAVVGRQHSVSSLVRQVADLVEGGCTRVKLKIGPDWDVTPVSAITGTFPSIAVQADANGAYTARQVDQVRALDDYGLRCIEQPFGRYELELHAEVARTMRTPFCLDESAGSPEEVRNALALGACSVVCVKPARLGGLGAALDVLAECAERQVPAWLGGMFETGYARGVNAALAALAEVAGTSWPGDLVPASEYLVDDVVPADPRATPATRFELAVPRGPGMGLAPVPSALARLRRSTTVHRP